MTSTPSDAPLEAVAVPSTRAKIFNLLKRRNFALLMGGRFSSNMGRSMRVFARAWLVLELTNSPFLLGVVTASLSWPMLFMPFLGGVLADRIDRRKLLIYTEFALVLLWTAVAIDVTAGYIQWWHLMISAILSGMIQSIGRPGHQAMLGTVVSKEELPTAVAIDSAADHWPRAVGLLLATVFIGTIGTGGVFWITAVSQLMTGITILLFKWEKQSIEAAKKSIRGNLLEGLKYVRGEPLILGLVLIAATASLFGGAIQFLMPFFARDILDVGVQGLGILMLFSTVGVSLGSLAIVTLSNMPRRGLLLLGAVVMGTLFRIGFSQSEIFFLSLGFVFGIGIVQTINRTFIQMILQMLAPDQLRGRVMGLQVSIQGLSWMGVLALGALAEFVGAATTVVIGASVSGLVAVGIFVAMPQLRRFK